MRGSSKKNFLSSVYADSSKRLQEESYCPYTSAGLNFKKLGDFWYAFDFSNMSIVAGVQEIVLPNGSMQYVRTAPVDIVNGPKLVAVCLQDTYLKLFSEKSVDSNFFDKAHTTNSRLVNMQYVADPAVNDGNAYFIFEFDVTNVDMLYDINTKTFDMQAFDNLARSTINSLYKAKIISVLSGE